jgi:type III pantothenate kinase
MLLVIDVGNTRIKTAVFEQYNMLELVVTDKKQIQKDVEVFSSKYRIETVFISSVGDFDVKMLKFPKYVSIINLSSKYKFPFTNHYATPHSLGVDRMVLAAGAVLQFPKKNRLVIDAGTCITYDYIDEKDNYLGGAISPGFKLRYESLHNYTAKLPLLNFEEPKNSIGNSTDSAIHSGVVNGVINEIEGFISDFKKQNKNFTIILTGGDAVFLAKRLKSTIFANSNFLLESLAYLYQYTNTND